MRTVETLRLSLSIVLLAAACDVRADDWPTARRDNQRSGVTAERLAPPLELCWTRRSPFPPAAGWSLPVNGYGARKNKPEVSYDDAFRIVAVADRVYFASSAEDCVIALDAATGREIWRFFTGGSPRLAPVWWQGRLYSGADDGVFRCLDAGSGQLLWQIDAAPRPDLMLGFGRFSSLWPIRAGGMVEEGIAYFSAGLFPNHRIYLFAVDAEDGRIIWRRPVDGGGPESPVPQGYMLATSDSLFTTSRVAPSRWRKQDGVRIDFDTPFPDVQNAHEYRFYNGGSEAQVWNGRYLVYGQACLLAYDPDRSRKDRWGKTRLGDLVFNWFNARAAVFHNDLAYLATDDHVLAIEQRQLPEIAGQECREFEETYKRLRVASYLDHLENHGRRKAEFGEDDARVRELESGPLRWGQAAWEQWQAARPTLFQKFAARCRWMTPQISNESLILAGDVLYAGGENRVDAIDANTGRALWSHETSSCVRDLAVAQGRLYVSTIDGAIRCFTPSSNVADGETRSLATDSLVEPLAPSRAADQRGYALVVGAGTMDLADLLDQTDGFRTEIVANDNTKVDELRRQLAGQKLYGGRACVRQADSAHLPYPPYLFDRVIAADATPDTVGELFRVTRPCGGRLTVEFRAAGGDASSPNERDASVRDAFGHQATVERSGDTWRITRGPVPESRDWTHNYATAANTSSSEDPLVKGPFGVLWYGEPGPRQRIDRHATGPMPLVVAGRMFTVGYDLVLAYDAYNGTCLWQREIPGAARQHLPINTSNLAADTDSLYVVVPGGLCLRLDAATGETVATYRVPVVPDGLPEVAAGRSSAAEVQWAWIAVDGNCVYGSRAEVDDQRRRAVEQTSDLLFALDRRTGQTLWTYRGWGIDHNGIALADGRVFLLDRDLTEGQQRQAVAETVADDSVADRPAMDRRGEPIPLDLRKLVSLDAATGQRRWERPLNCRDITLDDLAVLGRSGAACMAKDGVVVVHGIGSLGHPHREFLQGEFARRAIFAWDAESGDFLWGGRKGYRKRPIIVGDFVYAEPFAWELKTGRLKTVPNPLSGQPQPLDFHRGYIGCGHLLGSGAALFGARGGIAYCNLDTASGFAPFAGMHLACGLGAVPAGGIFVAPEGRSGCTCDTPIYASIALYPKSQGDDWSLGFTGGRAETVSLPVQLVSINLGAPGYRSDAAGHLWIPYPARVDPGPLGDWLPTYQHDDAMCYRLDDLTTEIAGTDIPWVYTSGYRHDKPLRFRLIGDGQPESRYTVRLMFAEPEEIGPGQRVFDVQLQGRTVLERLDVAAAAGGSQLALVREFRDIPVQRDLTIQLTPSETNLPEDTRKSPILCGFQAVRQ
ncbi:MAG: PQQ-binding-like beta-propeller repeat protein [Pirellulaceae bacterium]|nr:PQQ-binding-like beta-propeller repeat protein [Pirellulaceae bacterium]